MLNLKRRGETEKEERDVQKTESDDEFDFGLTKEVGTSRSVEEAEDVQTSGRRSTKCRLAKWRGSGQKRELKLEPTELRGGTEKGKTSGRVEKDRADQAKARTKTWANVVKGLKKDESETTNLDKS